MSTQGNLLLYSQRVRCIDTLATYFFILYVEKKIASLRPGSKSSDKYEIVYLQTKNYPDPTGSLEEVWCQVTADTPASAIIKMVVLDVHLNEMDSFFVINTTTCDTLKFNASSINNHRLEEVASLTGNFSVYFSGCGMFWIGFMCM
jgi:hypothetical protein